MKQYFVIIMLIISCILIAGCTDVSTTEVAPTTQPTPTSIETPVPELTPTMDVTPTQPSYVTCSDYSLITDRYKTPSGYYIISGNETYSVTSDLYNRSVVGYSAKAGYPGDGYLYFETYILDIKHIKPVSEKESGYRDACRIVI